MPKKKLSKRDVGKILTTLSQLGEAVEEAEKAKGEVSQRFTGFVDAFGVNIMDGDTLEIPWQENARGTVEWWNGRWRIVFGPGGDHPIYQEFTENTIVVSRKESEA